MNEWLNSVFCKKQSIDFNEIKWMMNERKNKEAEEEANKPIPEIELKVLELLSSIDNWECAPSGMTSLMSGNIQITVYVKVSFITLELLVKGNPIVDRICCKKTYDIILNKWDKLWNTRTERIEKEKEAILDDLIKESKNAKETQ